MGNIAQFQRKYSWQTNQPFCKEPYLCKYDEENPTSSVNSFVAYWRMYYVALKEAKFRRDDIEHYRSVVLPSVSIATLIWTTPFFITANGFLKSSLSLIPMISLTVGIVVTRDERMEQYQHAHNHFIKLRELNALLARYDRDNKRLVGGSYYITSQKDPPFPRIQENDPTLWATEEVRSEAENQFVKLLCRKVLTPQYFDEMY
jgi:hypothetical protein